MKSKRKCFTAAIAAAMTSLMIAFNAYAEVETHALVYAAPGENVTVAFSFTGKEVGITLISPDGQELVQSSPLIKYSSDNGVATYSASAKTGGWWHAKYDAGADNTVTWTIAKGQQEQVADTALEDSSSAEEDPEKEENADNGEDKEKSEDGASSEDADENEEKDVKTSIKSFRFIDNTDGTIDVSLTINGNSKCAYKILAISTDINASPSDKEREITSGKIKPNEEVKETLDITELPSSTYSLKAVLSDKDKTLDEVLANGNLSWTGEAYLDLGDDNVSGNGIQNNNSPSGNDSMDPSAKNNTTVTDDRSNLIPELPAEDQMHSTAESKESHASKDNAKDPLSQTMNVIFLLGVITGAAGLAIAGFVILKS